MSDFVLNKLEDLDRRLKVVEEHDHGPGYHEHLLDHAEHLAHHARMKDAKHPLTNRRAGERRGNERRTSTAKYEGEERRA